LIKEKTEETNNHKQDGSNTKWKMRIIRLFATNEYSMKERKIERALFLIYSL
jgi:hypothetical protein